MRAVLENKDHRLTPGLFARVKLLAPSAHSAMLVDDQAILTDQDKKYVYVLGPENRAMRRNIDIGRTVGNLRIVMAGLEAGDKVIVHGLQKVFFPGMPVNPQQIKMGEPEPAPGSPPGMGH
jgi:multidrug efflux system membrane fusion protein